VHKQRKDHNKYNINSKSKTIVQRVLLLFFLSLPCSLFCSFFFVPFFFLLNINFLFSLANFFSSLSLELQLTLRRLASVWCIPVGSCSTSEIKKNNNKIQNDLIASFLIIVKTRSLVIPGSKQHKLRGSSSHVEEVTAFVATISVCMQLLLFRFNASQKLCLLLLGMVWSLIFSSHTYTPLINSWEHANNGYLSPAKLARKKKAPKLKSWHTKELCSPLLALEAKSAFNIAV